MCIAQVRARPHVYPIALDGGVRSLFERSREVAGEVEPGRVRETVHPGLGDGLGTFDGTDVMRLPVVCLGGEGV